MITNRRPFAVITPRRAALLNANLGVSALQDSSNSTPARRSASTRIFGMEGIIAKVPRIATVSPLTTPAKRASRCDGRCDNPRRTALHEWRITAGGAAFAIPIRPEFVLVCAADVER